MLVLESIDRNALSASDLLNYELFAQAARIELMGQGIESGITQPAITVRDVPKQVLNLAVADVEQNSFYAPFLAMPTTLAPEVAAGLRRRGEEVAARFNRPGPFLANTYDLRARLIWEMEALTLHEAVPGNGLESRSGDRVFSRQFE